MVPRLRSGCDEYFIARAGYGVYTKAVYAAIYGCAKKAMCFTATKNRVIVHHDLLWPAAVAGIRTWTSCARIQAANETHWTHRNPSREHRQRNSTPYTTSHIQPDVEGTQRGNEGNRTHTGRIPSKVSGVAPNKPATATSTTNDAIQRMRMNALDAVQEGRAIARQGVHTSPNGTVLWLEPLGTSDAKLGVDDGGPKDDTSK
jgi:hypothetical protein